MKIWQKMPKLRRHIAIECTPFYTLRNTAHRTVHRHNTRPVVDQEFIAFSLE